jgi:DNA polymerase elongation subunit (family B)
LFHFWRKYLKFFTDVNQSGNDILVRGYEDGRRIEEAVKYKPFVFIPSNRPSTYKTLEGHGVEKVTFNSIGAAHKYLKDYEGVENFKIYGQTSWDYLYIWDKYRGEIEYDPKQISVVILDIETDSKGGFGDIVAADRAVTAITIRKNGKSVVFGTKCYYSKSPDVSFVLCHNEGVLLDWFLAYWDKDEWSPDVVTGWNVEGFDVPYLVKRITQVLGEDKARELSPWRKLSKRTIISRGKEQEIYIPVGIQVLDYMQVYRKFSFKVQESYSLDYISEDVLGQKKLEYRDLGYRSLDDLYERGYETFIDYNIRDCELIEMLENKLGMLGQIFAMAYLAKVNYSDMMATVRPWDGLTHDWLMSRNIVVPPKVKNEDKAFEGGFCEETPAKGYGWVVSFDVTSMYPHIIMGWNISPETFLGKLSYLSTDQLLNGELKIEKDVAVAGNMATYRRDIHGFLPQIMQTIFDRRVIFSKRMEEAEKKQAAGDKSEETKREISVCDNVQKALKTLMNSGYGAIANRFFRYFSIDNAQAITLTGQLAIRWVEKHINEYLNRVFKTKEVRYVIAVATDSVYVNFDLVVPHLVPKNYPKEKTTDAIDKFCRDVINPKIQSWFEELGRYTNVREQKLKMARECIADRAIWRGKNNYILNMVDKKGVRYYPPKLKIVGIEAIKSSTPAVCRKAIKDIFGIIMNGTCDDAKEYVTKFKSEYSSFPFEKIAFPRGLKVLEEYFDETKLYRKGTPAHVRGGILYNEYLVRCGLSTKYPLIYKGDKIKFAYLKSPNPLGDDVIAVPSELPPEFGLDKYVDRERQFQQTFLDIIESILSIVEWDISNKATLF